jgi:hypothetical protein
MELQMNPLVIFVLVASAKAMAAANMAAPVANLTADRFSPPSLKTARTISPPKTPMDCSFYVDVSGRDGRLTRSKPGGISASIDGFELRMHFGEGILPDADMVSASYPTSRRQFGDVFVEARPADRSDFRIERSGDGQPTYMREAPVLKIDDSWFVGDRVTFDKPEGLVAIKVNADFIEDFGRSRSFEIWWKGARRLTFHALSDKLGPGQFSAQCLAIPSNVRELTSRGNGMRRVTPSASPRLMSFVGKPAGLAFNPFIPDDKTRGSATFKISVGRDGLIKQCDLAGRSGKTPERPEACESVRRWARFYPATDRVGVPIETETNFSVSWTGR